MLHSASFRLGVYKREASRLLGNKETGANFLHIILVIRVAVVSPPRLNRLSKMKREVNTAMMPKLSCFPEIFVCCLERILVNVVCLDD